MEPAVQGEQQASLAESKGSGPRLVFERVGYQGGALHGTFDVGLHPLIGGEHDGPRTVLELASGLKKPLRGTITLGGAPPYSCPEVRRRIASTVSPILPDAATVQRVIEQISEIRGHSTETILKVLERLDQKALLPRSPRKLNDSERAQLALALALGHENSQLFALHEPFSVPGIEPAWLGSELERWSHASIVLISSQTAIPGLTQAALGFKNGALVGPQKHRAEATSDVSVLLVRAVPAAELAAHLLNLPSTLAGQVGPDDPALIRLELRPDRETATLTTSETLSFANARGVHISALRLIEAGRREDAKERAVESTQ